MPEPSVKTIRARVVDVDEHGVARLEFIDEVDEYPPVGAKVEIRARSGAAE